MSLSFDRDEMNELLFFGRAVPRQTTTLPTTRFYEEWMGEYFADYDLAQANSLLDEIGLDRKSSDGWRLGPDGEVFSILIETGPWENYPQVSELMAGYMREIGLQTESRTVTGALAGEKVRSADFDAQLQGFANVSEFKMHAQPNRFEPPWIRAGYMWSQWLNSNGERGIEPPEDVKGLYQLVRDFQAEVPGTDEYLRLGREVLKRNVEGLWAIGTVGLEPMPVVHKNYVSNWPRTGELAFDYYFWPPYQASTLYLDK